MCNSDFDMAFGEYPRNISPHVNQAHKSKTDVSCPTSGHLTAGLSQNWRLILDRGGVSRGDPQIFIEARSIPKIARDIRCGQSAIGPIQSRLWEQTTQWSEIS